MTRAERLCIGRNPSRPTAKSTNLIIDTHPTTSAVANKAKGAGTESMDYYKDCKKEYIRMGLTTFTLCAILSTKWSVVKVLNELEALAVSVSGDIPGTSTSI